MTTVRCPAPSPRRARGTVPAVLAVLAVLALLAGCGRSVQLSEGAGDLGEQGGQAEASASFLRAAADRTQGAGTGRLEMTMHIDDPTNGPLTFVGTGEYDNEAQQAVFDLDMSSLLAAESADMPPEVAALFEEPLRMVVDGTVMFMRFPGFGAAFGTDTEWISVDISRAAGADLLGGSPGMTGDPSAFLDFLRGAGGEVTEVGTADVRGTETTQYHGSFTYVAALEQAPADQAAKLRDLVETLGDDEFLEQPIPVDVFVDDDGLVRRMAMSFAVPDVGELGMEIDFFDFGTDVDIELPDPSDVTDVTDEALASTGGLR